MRPQKCQSFVQKLRGSLFPEGNHLSVISTFSQWAIASFLGIKVKNVPLLKIMFRLSFFFSIVRHASTKLRTPAPRGMGSQHLRTFDRGLTQCSMWMNVLSRFNKISIPTYPKSVPSSIYTTNQWYFGIQNQKKYFQNPPWLLYGSLPTWEEIDLLFILLEESITFKEVVSNITSIKLHSWDQAALSFKVSFRFLNHYLEFRFVKYNYNSCDQEKYKHFPCLQAE